MSLMIINSMSTSKVLLDKEIENVCCVAGKEISNPFQFIILIITNYIPHQRIAFVSVILAIIKQTLIESIGKNF